MRYIHLFLSTAALAVVSLTATFTAHAQAVKLPVVAIGPIEVAAQKIPCKGIRGVVIRDCNRYLREVFRAMLETAFIKTGKLAVMERGQQNLLLRE
ncbi:MAG: hypothetical protein OXH56_08990 [Gemmatimonadetes bacterium]|nr:hypothetical protein [Gemmatimonadota bacterium]